MDKLNDYEWINVTPRYRKCPHCAKGQLDTRVKRGFFVRFFLSWMNLRRYQCNSCEKKVYVKAQSQHQLQL